MTPKFFLSRCAMATAICVAPLMVGSAAAQSDLPLSQTREIMAGTVNSFVRPGYAAFHASSDRLVEVAQQLCKSPGSESLDAARNAFADTVLSWSAIEIVRFGPVSADNRFERVLFYPDRKGTGLRQVQAVLAGDEALGWTLEDLQGKSVAIQGLGGLEFALNGDGSAVLTDAQKGQSRCRYIDLAAQNLQNIGAELDAAWADDKGIASIWMNPGPDNPVLRDSHEALSQLLGTMIHGLEHVRDVRIGNFLGTAKKNGLPKTAIYRRAGLTMASIAANLASIERLFNESGIERALTYDATKLASEVRFEIEQTIKTANSFDAGVEALLADDVTRKRLEYLQVAIRSVIQRLDGEVSAAAGLSAGFSFGDGD
ncbi:putative periplasmic lipoprotein [Hoeflea sp. IMCC20628]|nr:putative periplasmic lipoprotein [Hoeflea sp. IMCC20628]